MLDGMIKTKLNIFDAESGSVLHCLKSTDNGFLDFGEVYFSTVKQGALKAWKLHQIMTLNLTVPIGEVLFCFVDERTGSKTFGQTFKIVLSQEPYFRLTVPPGIWFGFLGLSQGVNMIVNVANIQHDPAEVLRKPIDEINVNWSIE